MEVVTRDGVALGWAVLVAVSNGSGDGGRVAVRDGVGVPVGNRVGEGIAVSVAVGIAVPGDTSVLTARLVDVGDGDRVAVDGAPLPGAAHAIKKAHKAIPIVRPTCRLSLRLNGTEARSSLLMTRCMSKLPRKTACPCG